MSLFKRKDYVTELSPKSIREVEKTAMSGGVSDDVIAEKVNQYMESHPVEVESLDGFSSRLPQAEYNPSDYLVVDDGEVAKKIKASALTADVVAYKRGANIYNGEAPQENTALQNWSVGTTTMNDTWNVNDNMWCYPIMEVDESISEYCFLNADGKIQTVHNIGIYDENGISLAYRSGGKTGILPTGTKYIRLARKSNVADIVAVQPYIEGKDRNYDIAPYGQIKELKVPTKTEFNNLSQLLGRMIRPTVLFTFDQVDIDERASVLEANGFRGTYAYTNTSGIPLMRELTKRGHDFSIYAGVGDVDFTSTKEEWKAYIQSSMNILNSQGLYYPTMYSCRGHAATDTMVEACRELGFKYVRCATVYDHTTGVQDANTFYPMINENAPTNVYMFPYGLENTKEKIIAQIDSAIENNYTLVLFGHKPAYDGYSVQDYTDIVEYIKAKSDLGLLDCLTFREYYNKYHPIEGKNLDFMRMTNAIIDLHRQS